jgi:hypothetical protein
MLDYTAPSTVEEAVRILAGAPGAAKVLSGETDLSVQLRSGRAKPDLIVDIKNIPRICGIGERDGGFVIGAATPGAVIGECEALWRAWPEATSFFGSSSVVDLYSVRRTCVTRRSASSFKNASRTIRKNVGGSIPNAMLSAPWPVAGRRSGPGQANTFDSLMIIQDRSQSRPSRVFTTLGISIPISVGFGAVCVIGRTNTRFRPPLSSNATTTAQGRSLFPSSQPSSPRASTGRNI